jgi:hypothetical protein
MKSIFKLMILSVIFSISTNASCSLPGDEEINSSNQFCRYEKYKGREPDWCPRIEKIKYGFKVYDDDFLSSRLQKYLLDKLDVLKNKSKHYPVVFIDGNYFFLRGGDFMYSMEINTPNNSELIINYGSRFIKASDGVIVLTSIVIASSIFFEVYQDVSDPMKIDGVDAYLQSVVDRHLEYAFAPAIFRDATWKKFN